MTLLDAITDAGGVDPEEADLTSATIVRNGIESKLDLDKLLHQGDLSANLPLQPGDRIFVPLIHNRTYVFGAVGKSGYYKYTDGDRVLDELNEVGGPTQNADLSRVNVIHIDKTANTAKSETVDINKILTGGSSGDMKANIALAPGDIVYVPTKGHKASFGDIINGLSSIGIVNSVLRLL
jgi:polysaccharide export outer membrane protein